MGLKQSGGLGTARKKRSPAARVRRLVGKLLGRRRVKAKPPTRPGEDNVFEHLWRSATAASAHRKRFSIYQRNVLLFQMGKVASSALEMALLDRGLNCFHCHQLSYEGETPRLARLFTADPDVRLAAVELKLLAKHTALNMLVRWYRQNPVAPDRRLKVISLTRDPVSRFISLLLQQHGHDAGALVDWHRETAGGSGDVGAAASELLRQVATLIVQIRPSVDLAAAHARGPELAMAMTPPQPYLAHAVRSALDPLSWFDNQFRPIFGIDLRSLPEFAASGLAQRDLGFADVLIVRYEDLARHSDALARFVGLPALTLPARNVSAEKANGAQILDAGRSFQASALGGAFQRELRQSDYGRACGYDRSS